ncbi:uncharacterized protein [Macrobrachium rosenbergii]|uniref:uncharacterized protein n=1 Tax=Macrobrachium rosenbergii TaxID=79674 RepID=UPI0034D6CA3F
MALMALKWEDVPLGGSSATLLCDTSTSRPRPLVPASRRKQMFNIIRVAWHQEGRPPVGKELYSVPNQQGHKAQESGIGDFPQPRRCFGHIHIDVIGPLLQSRGARYLLAIIDRSIRWPEATPMEEPSTASCAEALLPCWISHFRVLDSISTDRDSAFLPELWVSLACLMSTTLHSTMSYNPTANGMVARAHHSLKAALMARCTDENWRVQLPWVLLGLRTTPRADGDASPAEKVYGETLAVLGEFFRG